MTEIEYSPSVRLARQVGAAWLAVIIVGVVAALFVADGIDINLSADVEATARNMLDAEQRLRAKAWIAALTFALDAFIAIGLYLLLVPFGRVLAAMSLMLALAGALVVLGGAVVTMNAAEIVRDAAFDALASADQRLLSVALQVISDYTSFHLGLVIATVAKIGFFWLFLRSRLIPVMIAGWGVFASTFVASAVVARDFVPALANNAVTAAFMLSNLVALVATGLYLAIKGVRAPVPAGAAR